MASKVDPNLYGLSIQLSLESADAFATLDSFNSKVSSLETNLTSAAQKALTSISQIATETIKNVDNIAVSFSNIDTATVKIQTALIDTTKELNTQFDKNEEQLKNFEEIYQVMEKMNDIQTTMGKELDKHLDTNESFLKGMNTIIKAVETKNKGHLEQNQLLNNDINASQQINKQLGSMNNGVKGVGQSWNRVVGQARQLWTLLKQIDADTEKFTTSNYRAYGAQQELVQGARNLALANSVTYEKAVEAYQVLGNLKVPKEEMEKYAKIVAMGTRVTGASSQVVAEYANRMRVAGLTAQQTERQVAHISEAMRKFGLSAADATTLMSGTADQTLRLKGLFGGSADAVGRFEKSKVLLAGMGKGLGLSAEGAKAFHDWLQTDSIALAKFSSYAGESTDTIEGFERAQVKAGLRTNEALMELEEQRKTGIISQATYNIKTKQMAEMFYGGSEAAMRMSGELGKQSAAMGLSGDEADAYNKIMGKVSDDLNGPMSEANQTLTAQWNLLSSKAWALIGTIGQLVADAIVPLLQYINWLIGQYMRLVGAIQEVDGWLRKHIPGYQTLYSVMRFVAGGAIALAIGFVLVTGAMSGFATVTSGVSGVAAGASRAMLTMGQTMVQLATMFGQAIKIILQSIGQGLAALGKAVQPVMVPLLALGLAFLLVGIGAYFFALALQIVVQEGTAAIPAAIGMIIVIGILGLVLIGLAMLIQGPVAVGLIVLAIAFIAIGIAALLTGFGLKLAAQGIQILSECLSFKLILQMQLLGTTLVLLGIMSLIAFPGLMLLSIAMLFLAGSAWLLSFSFGQIVAQTEKLTGAKEGNIANVGIAYLIAGVSFLAGAAFLLAASVLLTIAAPAILASTLLMGIASALLIPIAGYMIVVGFLLVVASALFFVASLILLPASIMFLTASITLVIGSVLLQMGSIALAQGSVLLVVASELLALGGIALRVALLAVGGTADKIFDIGTKIGIGGAMLLSGATSIIVAAVLLTNSGSAIADSVAVFDQLIAQMSNNAKSLGSLGFILLLGGLQLVAAASIVYRAGSELFDGASLLLQGAVTFETAVTLLGGSSGVVYDTALRLFEAGEMLLFVNMMFSICGSGLITSSNDLVTASEALLWAGRWLIPAALSIYIGMTWLEYAVDRFVTTVDNVEKIAGALGLISESFMMLSKTPMGGMREMSTEALLAIPGIEMLADRLVLSAQKLDEGATAFEGPAERLSVMFDKLGLSLGVFSAGLTVVDDIDRLVETLNTYAILLDEASEKIEVAIRTRVIPAMKAAEEAGIEEAIRSESLSTIKIMDETEASEAEDASVELQERMLTVLQSLDNRLLAMQSGKNAEIDEIVTLLKVYLPDLKGSSSGLDSQMNSWAR